MEQKYTGTKVVRVASAQRLIREGFKKDIGTDRGIYTYGDVTKLIDLTSSGVPVQAETPHCFGYGDSIPNQILNTNLETNAENGTV